MARLDAQGVVALLDHLLHRGRRLVDLLAAVLGLEEEGVVVAAHGDEDVDRGVGKLGGGLGAGGGWGWGCWGVGLGTGLWAVIHIAESGQEVASGFDEFVEEIVVAGGVREERIAGGKAKCDQVSERGADFLADIRELGQICGVLCQKAEKGEEGAPEVGPVVGKTKLVTAEVGGYSKDDAEGEGMQRNIEAPSEIVADCVGTDIKNDGGGKPIGRDQRWVRRPLATKPNGRL